MTSLARAGSLPVPLRALRFADWYVQLALHIVCAVAYAAVVPVDTTPFLAMFGWTTLVAALGMSGGYLLNNISDISGDAYKPQPFFRSRRQLPWAAALSMALFALALAVIHLVTGEPGVLVVAWSQLVLGVAYSVRPVRLKERGLLGVLCAAVMQRLPAFLMLAISVTFDLAATSAVGLWLTLIGLAFIADHQLIDLPNDERSGTRTWIRDVGRGGGLRARRWLYSACMAATVGLSVFIVQRRPTSLNVALAVMILVFSLALARAGERRFVRMTDGSPR